MNPFCQMGKLRLEGSTGQLAGMARFGLGLAPPQSLCSCVPCQTALVRFCDVGTEGWSFPVPGTWPIFWRDDWAPHVASAEGKG